MDSAAQTFTIRSANNQDLLAFNSINKECFSEGESYDSYTILYILIDNKYNYVAVKNENEIVGYVLSYFLDYTEYECYPPAFAEIPCNKILTICSLAVCQSMRNKGVGDALIKQVIENATNSDAIDQLALQVRVSNDKAIRLYERNGFIRDAFILKDYYNDPIEDGYFMSFQINKKNKIDQ